MAMSSVNKTFQEIVQKIYDSDLHFLMSETPFSAQIMIRKKFLKHSRTVPSATDAAAAIANSEVIDSLRNQIIQLEKNIKKSSEVNDILKNKLGQAEAQALKAYEEKKTEIETLKKTLKNSDYEAKKLKKDLEDEQKITKEKEKLLKKLDHKCENLTENVKNVKMELTKVKNENKKLSKNKERPTESLPTSKTTVNSEHKLTSVPKLENDFNRNILHVPDLKLHSCPSSSTTNALPDTLPSCTPTPGKPSCLPSSTPPVTPPRALPRTPPGSPSMSSKDIPPARPTCSHSVQCVIRQPRPPPPDKCTIMVHEGSRYHEHMDSQAGVPYQLGQTHEYCLRIDYENYGCEDCIWYKKWGPLHGYPDINPWTFQEHRQPLTYL